jgi:hypothetical protein
MPSAASQTLLGWCSICFEAQDYSLSLTTIRSDTDSSEVWAWEKALAIVRLTLRKRVIREQSGHRGGKTCARSPSARVRSTPVRTRYPRAPRRLAAPTWSGESPTTKKSIGFNRRLEAAVIKDRIRLLSCFGITAGRLEYLDPTSKQGTRRPGSFRRGQCGGKVGGCVLSRGHSMAARTSSSNFGTG